jgi:hypothetical protein
MVALPAGADWPHWSGHDRAENAGPPAVFLQQFPEWRRQQPEAGSAPMTSGVRVAKERSRARQAETTPRKLKLFVRLPSIPG